jgi:hypothetical protein
MVILAIPLYVSYNISSYLRSAIHSTVKMISSFIFTLRITPNL